MVFLYKNDYSQKKYNQDMIFRRNTICFGKHSSQPIEFKTCTTFHLMHLKGVLVDLVVGECAPYDWYSRIAKVILSKICAYEVLSDEVLNNIMLSFRFILSSNRCLLNASAGYVSNQ